MRYAKVLKSYRREIQVAPKVSLMTWCRRTHTNYRYMLEWMKGEGISKESLKAEAKEIERRRREAETVSSPEPAEVMGVPDIGVQLLPKIRRRAEGECRIRISFPDGTILMLQDGSMPEVASLMEIYRRRKKGGAQCSD